MIAAAATLWAFIGLFTPALLDLGVGPIEVAFWRALLAGGCFVVHAGLRRELRTASWRDTAGLLLFGVVSVGVFYVALAKAIDLGGVSLAWILLYTGPAWVAIAAVLFLREHVDAFRRILIAVTMLGVVLVAFGGGSGVEVSVASVAWGLLAGLSYASWYVGGKRFLPRYRPVTISALTLLAGAAVIVPFANLHRYPPRAWLLIAGLSVISTYLPVLLYYSGLQSIDASRAAIVATIEPVAALALGAAISDERLTLIAVIGALLVLGAAVLASAPRRATRDAVTAP
jgi:drug/metabolite transporter (DMT)-like permease